MKVCEIFKSIQGEGNYVGTVMLFIRLSGCTRSCNFCDTKYHTQGKHMSIDQILFNIRKGKIHYVCWTGGEPLMQFAEIKKVTDKAGMFINHHLETNGDLLTVNSAKHFSYVAVSPKTIEAANNAEVVSKSKLYMDIKIVTDLKLNYDLIKYATVLMPLTTDDEEKNKAIKRLVWDYCVEHNIKYSPRIHVDVWGKQRMV